MRLNRVAARKAARRTGPAACAVVAGLLLTAAPAGAVAGGAAVTASPGDALAMLAVGGDPRSGGHACTGIFVSPQWIATSASCLTGKAGAQAADGLVIGQPPAIPVTAQVPVTGGPARQVAVDRVAPRTDRDFALVRLAAPVPGIRAADFAATPPPANGQMTVAGFGRTGTEWVPDKPQTAALTVTGATGNEMAFTASGTTGVCRGDAGAPVLTGDGRIAGVVTGSDQHGCLAETATGTAVTAARTDDLGGWIRQNVPDLAIVCKPAAPIFTTRGDGTLWLYQHTDPRNGSFSWLNGNGQQIGSGWQSARSTAGPNGLVYQANSNGQLRKFRWNGTGWDLNTGPTPYYEVIDNGWGRYATTEYNNRITVDTRGHIYTVEPDGNLHWRSYDPAAKKWDHRIIGNGWGQYDLIAAAGDGVLYARTPNGDLFRHVYDAATGEWTQKAKPSGTGWNGFKTVTSPGADVLYGSYPAEGGGLLWYRYLPASDTWSDTGRANGKLIGTGWYGLYGMTATTDSCRLAT